MSYFVGFGWGFTVAILFAAWVERRWGCPYCRSASPAAPKEEE